VERSHPTSPRVAIYFASAGTSPLATSPRSRTIARVSSRASANLSNIKSISDSVMMSGGQNAMESPKARRIKPW